ncbi:hypothetical protein BOTBODRAFT_180506 [Botryobasidium botryosum FD-172 SS1]|uniref:Zn(2)-C6 fungal-type domain-containing protein n=1 Tax=Botryobasidium botryosum (strain FD-172 SS1) TaxID=930990 RepID=A0A067M7S1_BOTB1|nr:hypothetical protein BOTBODRAFT_180506 [Botryobasidium botryosum FD-172 SS1]
MALAPSIALKDATGDNKHATTETPPGWQVFDTHRVEIGVVHEQGVTHYHKPCQMCYANKRTACTGKAGNACEECGKSGSKCDYAFQGKANVGRKSFCPNLRDKSLELCTAPQETNLLKRKAAETTATLDPSTPGPQDAGAKRPRSTNTLVKPAHPAAPAMPLASGQSLANVPDTSGPRTPTALTLNGPDWSTERPMRDIVLESMLAPITINRDAERLAKMGEELERLKASHESECARVSSQRLTIARLQADVADLILELERMRRTLKERFKH